MKKNIAILTLAFASMFASTAFAQDNATVGIDANCPAKVERRGGPQDKMYRPISPMEKSMEGILLSIEQQQQVDALKADLKAKSEANGDSCKFNRRKAGKCMKKNYVEGMKKILTPEQYTQFLENMVFSADNAPAPMRNHMKADRMKGDVKCPAFGDKDCQKAFKKDCVKDGKQDCLKDGKKCDKKDCKKDCVKDGKKCDKKNCKNDCVKDGKKCDKKDCKKDCVKDGKKCDKKDCKKAKK